VFRMLSLTCLGPVILLACGCAWFGPTQEDPFSHSPRTRGVFVWRGEALADYRRFTVSPADIQTVEGVAMDPAVRQRIAEQLRRELVVRLARNYELVDSPGASVLKLKVTVTGVGPGPALGLAAAHVESRISDSVTGRTLLVISDRRTHRTPDPAVTTEWEAARRVMLSWADAVEREIEARR
jgi:hypothetical protein